MPRTQATKPSERRDPNFPSAETCAVTVMTYPTIFGLQCSERCTKTVVRLGCRSCSEMILSFPTFPQPTPTTTSTTSTTTSTTTPPLPPPSLPLPPPPLHPVLPIPYLVFIVQLPTVSVTLRAALTHKARHHTRRVLLAIILAIILAASYSLSSSPDLGGNPQGLLGMGPTADGTASQSLYPARPSPGYLEDSQRNRYSEGRKAWLLESAGLPGDLPLGRHEQASRADGGLPDRRPPGTKEGAARRTVWLPQAKIMH